MILPIPLPPMRKEDGVRFINLEKYPKFFFDLHSGFPISQIPRSKYARPSSHKPVLKVVAVGSFEASLVPTIKDFNRLDERFRLPSDTWSRLPMYKDYGFVVFKLRKGSRQRVHPMAFEFPRGDDSKLFFPTLHIHDGKVHAEAKFDHVLFCQAGPDESLQLLRWEESPQPAGMFINTKKAEGLVDGERHCYRRRMDGTFANKDQWV